MESASHVFKLETNFTGAESLNDPIWLLNMRLNPQKILKTQCVKNEAVSCIFRGNSRILIRGDVTIYPE